MTGKPQNKFRFAHHVIDAENVTVPREAELEKLDGGYALQIGLTKGKVVMLLPTSDQAVLRAHGLNSLGAITAARRDANGNVVRVVSLSE